MNSGIVANKGFVHQFATVPTSDGSMVLASPVLAGWSSIQSVGQIIGMVSLSFVSSRFGRKVAMYIYWLILATSVLAETLARSWEVWLVAKLLAGIGVGCMQSTLPTYIAEVAPVRIRGGLLMLYSLWWTIGSFFAYIAMQTMNKQHPTEYLTPIYTQWAQIGIMIIIYVFLPESPAWCVTRGDTARAKKALRTLNGSVEGYDVDHQLEVLVLSVEHERQIAEEQSREHWYAIFQGIDGWRTVTALWTNMSQQFIGLTLFGTFGTYFFQQAGLPDPFMIKCITSSINIATVIIVVFSADTVGRRWIACGGTTLMWVSCVVIGILGVAEHSRATDYVLVLFACFWSKWPSVSYGKTESMLTSSSRHRPDGQRSSGMGLHRRDLVPAPPALHGGVRRGKHLRHRRGHGPADAVHGQLDCMELGPEDGVVLRRRRPALHGRHVVSHSRDCSVSKAHCRIIPSSHGLTSPCLI